MDPIYLSTNLSLLHFMRLDCAIYGTEDYWITQPCFQFFEQKTKLQTVVYREWISLLQDIQLGPGRLCHSNFLEDFSWNW